MKSDKELIHWLLQGDTAIQYQTRRDLLKASSTSLRKLQARISIEGWGARFLSKQDKKGHWGRGYYQPKWTSTHYTLMDLKNLCLPRDNSQTRLIINKLLSERIDEEGSVNYSPTSKSDVCINGMVLSFSAYFGAPEEKLRSIIDYLLKRQMADSAWNCEDYRGAVHGSLHTTMSVLEGFLELKKWGYSYRQAEREEAAEKGRGFMLTHSLFKSDKTGEIIDKRFLMLSYPSRWRYDILRGLDYLREAEVPCDSRMQPALEVLRKKRRKEGTWPLQQRHPGAVHFDMEETGKASRWNTLRALRTLRQYPQNQL